MSTASAVNVYLTLNERWRNCLYPRTRSEEIGFKDTAYYQFCLFNSPPTVKVVPRRKKSRRRRRKQRKKKKENKLVSRDISARKTPVLVNRPKSLIWSVQRESDGVYSTLRASLSGTFLQRKDVVNQCLEFGVYSSQPWRTLQGLQATSGQKPHRWAGMQRGKEVRAGCLQGPSSAGCTVLSRAAGEGTRAVR